MKQTFKKGAASMYVVVIAALLFGVITVSFIRIVISESLRTTNSELAQSAYDSALAGVEDAKTAVMKYYNSCKNITMPGSPPNDRDECSHIKYYIENALESGLTIEGDSENCSTISNALMRNGENINTGEVYLGQTEKPDGSNTEQAYTCVTIANHLDDYAGTLDSANTIRVIPLKSGKENEVKWIKISWYDNKEETLNYNGYTSSTYPYEYRFSDNQLTPPVLSAQLIQTNETFNLSDFDENNGNRTDRGTLFLAPVESSNLTKITKIDKVNNGLPSDSGTNALAFSNSHSQTNYPFLVGCKKSASDSYVAGDYACSAAFSVPEPYNGGDRNSDTFFLVVTLPYGGPTTNFSIEMCGNVKDDGTCENQIQFDGVQTMVDSTGRANDMFSRVEARIEMTDLYFPYAEFALQLSGEGDGLKKNFYVTKNCWTNPGSTSCTNSGEAK